MCNAVRLAQARSNNKSESHQVAASPPFSVCVAASPPPLVQVAASPPLLVQVAASFSPS